MQPVITEDELKILSQMRSKAGSTRPGPHIESTLNFDICLISDSVPLHQLTDKIAEEIQPVLRSSQRPSSIARDRTCIHVIVLNLHLLLNSNRDYLKYSRGKNDYSTKDVYNTNKITFRIVQIVDALADRGFLELTQGYQGHNGQEGRKARLQTTKKYQELQAKFIPGEQVISANYQPIVLKDKNKRSIRYDDKPRIERWRANINKINATLQGSTIALPMDFNLDSLESKPETSRTALHRVFNSTWNKGGRFYGHWTQQLPGRVRQLLSINGDPVVELDFGALHPRMLYAKIGQEPPHGDIYTVQGVDPIHRDGLKKIMLVLFNCRSFEATVMAAHHEYMAAYDQDKIKLPPGVNPLSRADISDIAPKLMKKHQALKPFFYSGIGPKLQYQDSKIAEKIMLELADKGIPSIPIHDSFIVQAQHEEDLSNAMQKAYVDEIGASPVIDKK